MPESIHVSFRDDPDLAESFNGKAVGDVVTATVSFRIDQLDENGLVGSIEGFVPEGFEPEENAQPPGEPEEAPALLVLDKKRSS